MGAVRTKHTTIISFWVQCDAAFFAVIGNDTMLRWEHLCFFVLAMGTGDYGGFAQKATVLLASEQREQNKCWKDRSHRR